MMGLRFIAMFLILANVGCYRIQSPYPIINSDLKYFSVLNRWTQSAKAYREFETAFTVDVTFYSWEFRKALIAEKARTRQLSVAEQKRLLAEEEMDYQSYLTFNVNLYAPKEEWNNLDKKSSIWKIAVRNAQKIEYLPFSITAFPRDDPEAQHLFPYINAWTTCYLVKFRRANMPLDGGQLQFVIASFIGAKQFDFKDVELVQILPVGAPPPSSMQEPPPTR